MNCPNCRTEIPGDSVFCHNCGASIAPPPSVAPKRPAARRALLLAAGAGGLALAAAAIAAPRLDAILAVIRPADTDYLYYLLKLDGSHAFAETLEEHLQNIEVQS